MMLTYDNIATLSQEGRSALYEWIRSLPCGVTEHDVRSIERSGGNWELTVYKVDGAGNRYVDPLTSNAAIEVLRCPASAHPAPPAVAAAF